MTNGELETLRGLCGDLIATRERADWAVGKLNEAEAELRVKSKEAESLLSEKDEMRRRFDGVLSANSEINGDNESLMKDLDAANRKIEKWGDFIYNCVYCRLNMFVFPEKTPKVVCEFIDELCTSMERFQSENPLRVTNPRCVTKDGGAE